MSTNSPIRQAARCALLTGVATVTATPAFAAEREMIQEIVVTGTRIIRTDYVANSPLTSVTQEQIIANQDVTLDTFLNTLPQASPDGTTTSNNPGNSGQSTIDLRGLGANRNLVLIDGRRAMVSASSQTVDLNTIPQALIERIEIITGGAGAAYGADAVAGAVNIVLQDRFEGMDFRVGMADTQEYDAHEYNGAVTVGANFAEDRGNAVIAFEYSEREGLIKRQRDFAAVATATTSFLPEGLYFTSGNAPSQAAVDAVFGSYGVAAGAVPANGSLIGFNVDGTLFSRGVFNSPLDVENFRYPLDLSVNSTLFPDVYSYNFDSGNILTLPLERRSLMMKSDLAIGERVEVFTQVGYTQYSSTSAIAPAPISTVSATAPGEEAGSSDATSSLIVPGRGSRISQLLIVPVTNPFIPADFAQLLASRTGDNPSLVGSGADEPFLMRQRTLSAGLRQSSFENTVVQYMFGARGEIAGSWRWEAYASEGRTEIDQTQAGNVDTNKLLAMLAAPDGGASTCEGGFDPFGRQPISAECLDELQVTNTVTTELKQQILQAFVSGKLLDLSSGPLSVVLGAEYRGFRYSLDPGAASGPISGFNTQAPARGTNSFNDIFAEALIPIASDARWAKAMDISLGFRASKSEFSDLQNAVTSEGSTDNAYKVELSWQTSHHVRTRASYQRAVRAPNFTELFDGTASAPQYFDPCSVTSNSRNGPNAGQLRALCQDAGAIGGLGGAVDTYVQTPGTQVQLASTGNTALTPEKADTYTLGLVLTSPWSGALSQFRASLDYYRIDVSDALLMPDTNLFVADCYNFYGNNPSYDPNYRNCSQLFRAGGDILAVANLDDPEGLFRTVNTGVITTDGLDLQVEWATDVGPGKLAMQLYLNYLLNWEEQAAPGFPKHDFAGTVAFLGAGDGLGQSFPEMRASLSAHYSIGRHVFDVRSRFIDSMDNRAALLYPGEASQFTGTPSITYFDLGASWHFLENSTLRLGVNNVFDKLPPTYRPNIQSGTDPSLYDVIGRRVFVQAAVRF
jgi:outer membrane receptor protein involved in Fe transport